MKKDEFLKQVAETLKLNSEDVNKLFTEEDADIELTLPAGDFWKKEDLDKRIRNEKISSYSEGKKAGEEMPVKELRNELKLDLGGEDTVENLIKSYKAQLETELNKEPNKALEEKEQIVAKLQKSISDLEAEKESIIKEQRNWQLNNQLLSAINGNLAEGWDKEDIITLFRSRYQVDEVDGKNVVKKNGEIIRDSKTQEELTVDTVFSNFINEKGIIKQDDSGIPGRGGKNEPGKGGAIADISQITNKQTYNDYLENNKIEQGSDQDFALFNTLSKENPVAFENIAKGK